MEWFEFALETTHEAAEAIGGVLISCGIACWATEDKNDLTEFMDNNRELWDYVDEELLKKDSTVIIKVYLPDNQQGRDTLLMLSSSLEEYKKTESELDLGSLKITVGSVNEEDWANTWKKYFHPIDIGNKLTVRPSWEEYDNKDNRTVLTIDPGSAFGTGGHATTKLCLETLDAIDCTGKQVLDVGCGSGILAVASLLLGADNALGVDIDLNSVNVAEKTAKENNVSHKAEFRQADLVKGVSGSYDIITANIVADIVIRLTPDVPALLKDGGTYIVSGIIDQRCDDVTTCLSAYGFTIRNIRAQEGWVAIEATK